MTLCIEENIPNQKGLTCVLLANHHHHRTFLGINLTPVGNHLHIELSQLEVHSYSIQLLFSRPPNRELYEDDLEAIGASGMSEQREEATQWQEG